MNFAGIVGESTRQARSGRARVYSCPNEKKKVMSALAPEVSREAAKECSPRRKPWVRIQERTEPRRGQRIEFGRIMRHPERSCSSSGAKDLPCNVTVRGARNRNLAERIES
jgi:hypothetical protein